MTSATPEPERSPEARTLAERALVLLLRELDGSSVEVVVIGGLVPEILTEGQDPPAPQHLGTTDVDLLLRVRVDAGEDLGPLEGALKRLDFDPAPGKAWRWSGTVSGRAVRIEFLCDVDTEPDFTDLPLPGCEDLQARNIRGTGYVARDFTKIALRAIDGSGTEIAAEARFARLGGYLLSKCVAARTRGASKDYYDLIYVLLHNRAGGPAAAAGAVFEADLGEAVRGELRGTLIEARERFRSPTQVGPDGFALETLRAHPDEDEAPLRADAVAAAREFFEVLLDRDGSG